MYSVSCHMKLMLSRDSKCFWTPCAFFISMHYWICSEPGPILALKKPVCIFDIFETCYFVTAIEISIPKNNNWSLHLICAGWTCSLTFLGKNCTRSSDCSAGPESFCQHMAKVEPSLLRTTVWWNLSQCGYPVLDCPKLQICLEYWFQIQWYPVTEQSLISCFPTTMIHIFHISIGSISDSKLLIGVHCWILVTLLFGNIVTYCW